MKNSLFKRALATVASVPLALSQCLTCASYAVTNDSVQSTAENTDSSEKEAYTLKDNLLYIAPGQVESTWYSAFNAELVAIGNKKPVGYVTKETISNAILNRAGKYESKAQLVIDMLSDEDIKYVVSATGDVTITGKIVNPDLSALMDTAKVVSIDDTMKALADKYGAPEIKEADFSSVDFSGTYEIVIEGSDLANGNTFDVKAKYIANTPVNGKTVFSAGDATDVALAKFNEIKSIAYASIDSANLPADKTAEAKAEFDGKFTKYEKWINKAKNNQDKVYTVNRKASSPNMKSLIEKINNYIDNGKYSDKIDKVEDKYNRELNIPATAKDIVNNSYVASIYDAVLKEINKTAINYDVQISADDIASFADNDLYNLTATASEGTYTLTGDFPDDEVTDSVKHMVATVKAGDIYDADGTLATVGFRIYRDPIKTTTTDSTTTTDTTTTTTATTDTDTDTTTTTTVTTGTGSDTDTDTDTNTTTVTTVTTGTGSDTDTDTDTNTTTVTTVTTGTGSDTGTDTDTNTTTVTTVTTGTGSDTGTDTDTNTTTVTTVTTGTGSDTGTDTNTTTTTDTNSGTVLNGEVKSWSVSVETSGYGFYYSHEEEFHKEQIEDVILHVVYVEDDKEDEDIKIDFDFASTPSETFVRGDRDFKYDAVLNYAGGTISDTTGKIILTSGDVLKALDGSDASVEVYIGYMGDVDLDYDITSADASQVLGYYAETSTGKGDPDIISKVQLSLSNELVTDPNSVYDHFAAFLGDVNRSNGDSEFNWKAEKADRVIDSVDASCILSAYAFLSLGNIEEPYEIGTQRLWDAALQ